MRGTTDWAQASLSLAIPPNAARVLIGVLSLGKGSLWLDDAHLEDDGGTSPSDFGFESATDFFSPVAAPRSIAVREAARALSPRGLANLTAFTRARTRALLVTTP